MWDLLFILMLFLRLCDSVFLFVKTFDYENAPTVYYFPGISSAVTQLVFTVRAPDDTTTGYVGLSPVQYSSGSSFWDQAMYEATIGSKARLRNSSQAGTWLSTAVTQCIVGNGVDRCMSSTVQQPYWIQWNEKSVLFGGGNVVGQGTFWKADVSSVGYQVNFVSFAGGKAADPLIWKYQEVQPLLSPDVTHYENLKLFVPTANGVNHLNDNNTASCMKVATDHAGSYLFLQVFADPPLTLSVKLTGVLSCEASNLFLMDRDKVECKLIDSIEQSGIHECIFQCLDICTSVVALGFQKARFGPQIWKICEMAEVRNRNQGTITAT